jgi:hypothetical protein
MAKKITLTAQMVRDAQPTVAKAVAAKCKALGAKNGAGLFKGHATASERTTRKFYKRFLDEGGKVGDFQSFLTWLLEHGDELISFISKLIALFSA